MGSNWSSPASWSKRSKILLEIRTFSQWKVVRTRLIEMEPPFVLEVKVFFFWKVVSMIFIYKNNHRRQTFASRLCSIIRTRNSWSRKNRSWIPWNFFFLHFFFNCLVVWYSLSPGFFPYLWPWSFPYLMTHSGSERKSIVYWTNFRLTAVSFWKKKVRMCNGRCLHSNLISMLCTAFWVPSRAIHTIRCCPRLESFSLTLD